FPVDLPARLGLGARIGALIVRHWLTAAIVRLGARPCGEATWNAGRARSGATGRIGVVAAWVGAAAGHDAGGDDLLGAELRRGAAESVVVVADAGRDADRAVPGAVPDPPGVGRGGEPAVAAGVSGGGGERRHDGESGSTPP